MSPIPSKIPSRIYPGMIVSTEKAIESYSCRASIVDAGVLLRLWYQSCFSRVIDLLDSLRGTTPPRLSDGASSPGVHCLGQPTWCWLRSSTRRLVPARRRSGCTLFVRNCKHQLDVHFHTSTSLVFSDRLD